MSTSIYDQLSRGRRLSGPGTAGRPGRCQVAGQLPGPVGAGVVRSGEDHRGAVRDRDGATPRWEKTIDPDENVAPGLRGCLSVVALVGGAVLVVLTVGLWDSDMPSPLRAALVVIDLAAVGLGLAGVVGSRR